MNGLWIAHYRAGGARGEGMMMFRAGEILGGDFAHAWTGTYEEDGSHLSARLRVAPCMSRGERGPLAREHPVMVTLSGECTERDALLRGHPDESVTAVTIEMHKAA